MSEKIIFIEDIGEVKIRKNKRSRNISISMRPSRGIVVNIPYYLSYKYGLRILEEKREWIEKNLPKIKALENGEGFPSRIEYPTMKMRTMNLDITPQDVENVEIV